MEALPVSHSGWAQGPSAPPGTVDFFPGVGWVHCGRLTSEGRVLGTFVQLKPFTMIGVTMKHLLLGLLMALGSLSLPGQPAQAGEDQSKAAEPASNDAAPAAQDAPGRSIAETAIKAAAVDVVISEWANTPGSAPVKLAGHSNNNETIASLIKTLEAHPQFSEVYLESTEKTTVDKKERRSFKMTTKYTAK